MVHPLRKSPNYFLVLHCSMSNNHHPTSSTTLPTNFSDLFHFHVLPILMRHTMLNVYSIAFLVLTSDMRTIRIHHEPCFLCERDGFSADRACIQVNNSIKAYSRICAHLCALSVLITYFVIHVACVNCQENQRCSLENPWQQNAHRGMKSEISKLQSRHQKPNRVAIAS